MYYAHKIHRQVLVWKLFAGKGNYSGISYDVLCYWPQGLFIILVGHCRKHTSDRMFVPKGQQSSSE